MVPLWRLPPGRLSPHTDGRSARTNERMVALFGENRRSYLVDDELFDLIHATLLY